MIVGGHAWVSTDGVTRPRTDAAVRRMRPIPLKPRTEALARRLVWFEEPADALADLVRFVAYALESATLEDMRALREYVTDADIRGALEFAPPGIIGPRSWAYWNARMGRYPAPPTPTRNLG